MSADLVIVGGRVIDPLSGFDEVADVAVTCTRSLAPAAGALGVGVLVGYAPGTAPDEDLAVAAAAARAGRPVFTHARELVDRVLGLVERCRAEGGRVTTEAYPYGSGSTGIGAAFLDPELLPRWGLTLSSIIYMPTGERVANEARLRELRARDPGGLAIFALLHEDHAADRDLLDRGMLGPDTMVASDAMPRLHDGQQVEGSAWPLPPGMVTHPRTAGTFARTLRRYVREDGTMGLNEAIRRSATLPALALQDMSLAMRRKGRVQVDADADIAALDLASRRHFAPLASVSVFPRSVRWCPTWSVGGSQRSPRRSF